ncbi:MAG TPA: hypothetical protein PL125_06050 [Candidatus Omnitrophota bacterium]|nr:hypothetical protein [Candidatus Omnitrophota bacterium]HPT39738.1 hypothetical protein [Candidatus Omnitrophota bacterium]
MKHSILTIAVLFVIFMAVTCAHAYDSQSISSHYNQYSTDNITSPYNQYEVEYSPKNISNPYSQYEVQYSPNNVGASAGRNHDYRVGNLSGESADRRAQEAKGLSGASQASNFLNNAESKKSVPLFFYLLVLASLAVGLTFFVIISIFRK